MLDNTIWLYLIQAFVNLFICACFLLNSFKNKFRYSKKTTFLIAGIYIFISVSVIELFLENISPFHQYHLIACLVWTGISILFAVLAFKVHLMPLLFYIFAVMDIQINIMLISKSICSLGILPEVMGSSDITYLFVSLAVLLLLIPSMRYLYNNLFKKVIDLDLPFEYWKNLFILPISFFMFFWFIISSSVLNKHENVWNNLMILIFLNVCVFLSYIAVLQLLIKTNEELRATEKFAISEQMIMVQKEQYQQLVAHIEKNDRAQHDFRHHLIVIKDFLEKKDVNGLQNYLNQYNKENLPEDNNPLCNNHFADVILRHYITKAKTVGIKVCVSMRFLEDFAIPETDLCVVLGNLFENALESCERQKSRDRFIDLKVKRVSKSMLAITLTNSYDGEIRQRGKLFLSNKHENMGIGVSTICSIAEKNGGSCKFSFENGVFKASVLLVA